MERFGLQFEYNEGSMEFTDFILKYYYKFPLDLFHYIRKYYRLSEVEYAAYCKCCRIKDCENVWDCTLSTNSKNLFHSYDIVNSSFIRDSSYICSSNNIYNTISAKFSNNIVHSSSIKNSNIIVESQEIDDSDNIARSNNISWSSVILNSARLNECSYTYMSQDLIDCHFCGFMKNSRHCMFCVGLEDKEYYIFNQQVTPMEYERIKEKLVSILEEETSKMIRVDESKHTAEERFKLNRRFDSVFNGLSSDFYGWVGTLPNYSDNAFVDLFFRDRETKTIEN